MRIMALMMGAGCSATPFNNPVSCIQIDVIPQETELPGDGISSTTVDMAVCSCSGEETCPAGDRVDGITVELSVTAGTLDRSVAYLYDGTGSATWIAPAIKASAESSSTGRAASGLGDTGLGDTGLGDTGLGYCDDEDSDEDGFLASGIRGVMTATIQSFGGTGTLVFHPPDLYPTSFSLSSDSDSLVADGNSTARITLLAGGLDDGMWVSIDASHGQISPESQVVHNESAQFVYRAPGTDITEVSEAILLGRIDDLGYYSDPLSISLTPATGELSLSPSTAMMVEDSSVKFTASGKDGVLEWSSPASAQLLCNGTVGLSGCSGESEVEITLAQDPCEESSEADSSDTGYEEDTDGPRCEILLWVTDGSGAQASADIEVY